MAFSQEQLDALDAAIARGVRTVSYNGESVTYNSFSEMREARNLMRRELGQSKASQASCPVFQREF